MPPAIGSAFPTRTICSHPTTSFTSAKRSPAPGIKDLSMVCCNLVYLKEGRLFRRKPNTHWLRYRFREDRTILPASDLQDHIAIGTNTAWFRRDLIEMHKLRYDPRVVPTFEDGHFTNRFLLLNPCTKVAFVKGAVYLYRKRADGSSTLDKRTKSRLGASTLFDTDILIFSIRHNGSPASFPDSSREPCFTMCCFASPAWSITRSEFRLTRKRNGKNFSDC